jgi:23S rRNA-/tRNA-specific pseudouridylate synthase
MDCQVAEEDISNFKHQSNANTFIPRGRKRVSNTWTIPESLNDARIHKALLALDHNHFPTASAAKNNLRKGLILLNDTVCGVEATVKTGDVVGLLQTFGAPERILIPLNHGKDDVSNSMPTLGDVTFSIDGPITPVHVCFEDKHMAVVVKPQGMPVFREKDSNATALATVLCHQINLQAEEEDSNINYRRRPQPVHRLDRETGGLVLVAKTYSALRILIEAFVEHKIRKTYFALIEGSMDCDSGTISIPLGDKEATTNYRQLWTKPYEERVVSMVELNPITGRKNQLRK